MKVKKIEFGWNENVVNPSDVVTITIEERGSYKEIRIEGEEAEKFILDIEEQVKQYVKKWRE